ncbi:MAG: hypothetical protein OQK55_03600, partial [Thermoanaerobaculales bacterium]|nr:hypothetical protein [Thermoanaerobaculales bacterium]
MKTKAFVILLIAGLAVAGLGTAVATAEDAQVVKAQVDRTELPIKGPWYPPITTLDARDATAPPIFEVRAPEDAPNVVIILLDDLDMVIVVTAYPFWLEHDGERLKVWHAAGTGRRALIYFGGNAEDVSHNIGQLKRLLPSYHLYLHNYRGYGGSSGAPGEQAILADSLALYERVREQHDEVAVIGRSLGT